MSKLSESLGALEKPKSKWPSSISDWLEYLPQDDRVLAWKALRNPNLKTYTIFNIFREDTGLRASKDTFKAFREEVLAGTTKEEDFDGS